ncbi:hypothetical protein IF2G_09566 [Cordyceps javanica]|nr:hypothetical protein IF2G_09566 [Cordyceps javanica]
MHVGLNSAVGQPCVRPSPDEPSHRKSPNSSGTTLSCPRCTSIFFNLSMSAVISTPTYTSNPIESIAQLNGQQILSLGQQGLNDHASSPPPPKTGTGVGGREGPWQSVVLSTQYLDKPSIPTCHYSLVGEYTNAGK